MRRLFALKKMLYKETNLLKEDKKGLAVYIYLINKHFDKLLKQQRDEIFKFFEDLKTNYQIMVGDAYNLIKLRNINLK